MASDRKKLALALQGGGSHGAFTWGVLERLAEENGLLLDAFSGVSAGAINAALYLDGMRKNALSGTLEAFWKELSIANSFSPLQRNPFESWMERWNMDATPAFMMYDFMARVLSPYQCNPFNYNPLRLLLSNSLDFDALRALPAAARLFINATNVRTHQSKVFTGRDLSPDMLLASCCVPYLFQAVEVDGEHYWDGGYSGNPPLLPLAESGATDILIVRLHPAQHDDIPKSSAEILDRMNEISFHRAAAADIAALRQQHPHVRLHLIAGDTLTRELGVASKLNAEWKFLTHLRQAGRDAAGDWIKLHLQNVGVRSTLDT